MSVIGNMLGLTEYKDCFDILSPLFVFVCHKNLHPPVDRNRKLLYLHPIPLSAEHLAKNKQRMTPKQKSKHPRPQECMQMSQTPRPSQFPVIPPVPNDKFPRACSPASRTLLQVPARTASPPLMLHVRSTPRATPAHRFPLS